MTNANDPAAEHLDVLIVGAGISGIDAAYHIQKRCPGKTWAILEGRDAIGGTWDLFRFPGIRSDSDMYTLGFPFRPWRGEKAIVEGAAIRDYVEETARHYGIDKRIRFGHKVVRASWSSAQALWTVETEGGARFTCFFLFLASGYYDYAGGYRPDWPGESDFPGRIVHPQHWPEDLEVAGKSVVVIGSGATAVTLVPALAEAGARVTMLQRTPSYVVARPSRDALAKRLQRLMPLGLADSLTRWKNVLLGNYFFSLARRKPERARATILRMAAESLPEGYDVERHFAPAYKVWDQRLCLVPDGDLFAAIEAGTVEVVTDTIETFTRTGVRLASGRELAANVVVTATGLVVRLLGGIAVSVDGKPVTPAERLLYKGMMLSDVPNFALAFGYVNASWTLKADLTSRYLCRLLRHMDRHGFAVATPRPAPDEERRPMLEFTSGYVQRAAALLPGQGANPPWRVHQNYLKDVAAMRFGAIADAAMEFRKPG